MNGKLATAQRARRTLHDLGAATGIAPADGLAAPIYAEFANGSGPTVVLLGGIHGDEHEAQVALSELIAELDPNAINGRLVVIPALNYPAAMAGARVSTADGQNMNRVFPGKADGTPTERLAHWFMNEILPGADLLIDVHAGGRAVSVVPMVFGFSDSKCRVAPDQLLSILRRWGYRNIQHMACVEGTVCHAALGIGVASVEVEGGGGSFRTGELTLMREGIRAGLKAFGVLAGEPLPEAGTEFDAHDEGQVHAPADGAVEHLVPLGSFVEGGQIIARLHPIGSGGGQSIAIAAPLPGLLLRQCQSAWLKQGAQVGNIGTLR